jgi:hypothetical protein
MLLSRMLTMLADGGVLPRLESRAHARIVLGRVVNHRLTQMCDDVFGV